jgi:aminoglycoside phosphotransferase (APT) family kinase protein
MVWNGGAAVGLIDWDQAHPAPAMDDVAYALEYLAPFRSDEHAIRWQGFTGPPDRMRRIALFAQAYGLDSPTGLVDAVIARQRRTIAHVRHLADKGVQPQRDWVAAGHLAEPRAATLGGTRRRRGRTTGWESERRPRK